jgi:hypothetical protein
MKTTDKKDFDCVKSVRKERERIAGDTEGKSPKEILEYFKKRKGKTKS